MSTTAYKRVSVQGVPYVEDAYREILECRLAEAKAEVEQFRACDLFPKRELARCNSTINALRQDCAQLRARVAELERSLIETRADRGEQLKPLLTKVAELEQELKATQKQANDEFDAIITRNMELEADKARLEHIMSGKEVTTVRGGFPYVGGLWYQPTREEIDAAIDAAKGAK